MTQRRRPKRKSHWLAKLFICFVIYFVVMLVVQQTEMNRVREEAAQLEQEMNDLERNNQEMSEQAEIINSDEYIEYLVRLKLGWIKADEREYIGVTTEE